MIRNRLSELLSERGLKISRVSKEVDIARSSLTSMVQNESEMIRYDAIERLCTFLNITPNEFFEYNPLAVEYSFDEYPKFEYAISQGFNFAINLKKFEFDFLIDIKNGNQKQTFDLDVSYEADQNNTELVFIVNNEDTETELKEIIKTLSPGLKNVLYKKIQKHILIYVAGQLANDISNSLENSYNKSQVDSLRKTFEKNSIKLISDIFTEY